MTIPAQVQVVLQEVLGRDYLEPQAAIPLVVKEFGVSESAAELIVIAITMAPLVQEAWRQ
ncbi:Uncharacterised protein [Mycobacteroides abscessus]|uniref:hypothetical protein n=1 Tax=Mycobacteroides abscessus TaxID=36809 RepID=UPI0005DCC09B|nr:hypothetical protein [Mycobacteroides abscessus]CPV67619.1 Uncharacterised protein [Mycobacteroides abscessus]SHQ50955.1 Uncharacterised protein [Mycobacteroides abscessus subsp. abscessus]SHR10774.1 Uncharacterised protein [Mycobacteroides abscessus subsp. abscessus]SHR11924.1 Uncharacterised protein [Mycobacteroides abscessus subsp. abscessus]SHR55583.1 Uncharacterised protein [Mycobacteroides abscessus subsp. abscessus]